MMLYFYGRCCSDPALPTIFMVGTLRRHTRVYVESLHGASDCEREHVVLHVHYLLDESGGHAFFTSARTWNHYGLTNVETYDFCFLCIADQKCKWAMLSIEVNAFVLQQARLSWKC